MNWPLVSGAVLTVAGLAGYVVGVLAVYPGRALAVTAVMVGVTLVAVAGTGGEVT